MRSFTLTLVSSFLVSSFALAASPLDSVKDIECDDPHPTNDIQLMLTTSDRASHKYERRANQIPFNYGNAAGYTYQSGVFNLMNNPGKDGVWVLFDQSDSNSLIKLILTPTAEADKFTATLTGGISIGEKWIRIKDYPMECVFVR